jgi:hypothetical protein
MQQDASNQECFTNYVGTTRLLYGQSIRWQSFDGILHRSGNKLATKFRDSIGIHKVTPKMYVFKPLKTKLVYILFKNSVRTSKRTPNFTITKIN